MSTLVKLAVASAPPRFHVLTCDEFLQGKSPSWLVHGVIPDADLVVIFGESGSGKSFFVLDLIASIGRGEPWRGLRVTQGRVAYVAAEGAGGFRKRIKAYLRQHDIAGIDLFVLADAPNFMERSHIADVIAGLNAVGPVKVVVVDTLAQVMPGGNENSGEDLGKVVGHCKAIRSATGAVVVLIHHSGKNAGKGARGWSGLRAAADAEIEIVRIDNDRVATVTKMKDGEDGQEFGFRLLQVPVGQDDEGEVVTSCVVEPSGLDRVDIRKPKKQPRGKHERNVMQVICDLPGVGGGWPTEIEVIDEAISYMVDSGRRPDRRRDLVKRALDTLISAGDVVSIDGRVGVPRAN